MPVVETVQNQVVENNVADNAEDKPRQERQRRTPRHFVHRIINAAAVMK